MREHPNTDVILALADYIRGVKVAVIGAQYGFDDSTIVRVARRMGINTRGRGRPINQTTKRSLPQSGNSDIKSPVTLNQSLGSLK